MSSEFYRPLYETEAGYYDDVLARSDDSCHGHWHWPDCDGQYGHPRGHYVPYSQDDPRA